MQPNTCCFMFAYTVPALHTRRTKHSVRGGRSVFFLVSGAAHGNKAHTEQSKQRSSDIKQRRGLEVVAGTKVTRSIAETR